ncbi:E3 ubiquitin-protein ligase RNF25 isoform X3 [Gadus macrocephalus]|uniref:E3 ubiquitin-protein ligase RNF25 isoform X3 n=1 Tax=Gadus macrocephalus TaxID=80720 RepID=UPI0028CB62DD|nr:E3 ubiquitin-protein ligase RNF25 isoform X3 [Gadus macrocephalus]
MLNTSECTKAPFPYVPVYSVQSEIEVLQSIYLDELQVTSTSDGSQAVSLVLYPSTAEDSVSQFVRLTLKLTLDQQYPSSPPSISIHNPRGLSDDMLSSVLSSLQAEAESCLGSPVLYQLIEKAKEILTESNIPHGNCVICLYGFKESEAFTKTSCYHYFHAHCLGRYVTHSEEEVCQRQKEQEQDKTQHPAERQGLMVVCPVCREPLTYDAGQLLSSPAPLFPQEGAAMGTDFVQKWRELQELLERQRAKGGIIDPDVESNRFLIHINEVPSEGENGDQEAVVPPGFASAVPAEDVRIPGDQARGAPWPCRGGPGHRRHGPFRGPRRGGRGRPHPPSGRPSPPTEGLDKLHLPSDGGAHPLPSAQGPLRPRPRGPPKGPDAEPAPANTDKEDPAGREHPEPPDSADKPPLRQPTPGDPDPPAADGEPDGGPDKRGRRRGPRPGQWHDRPERHARGTNQWDPQGGWHPRWEGRGSGCRGGGPRRGPSRGSSHQKVQERDAGREEVL